MEQWISAAIAILGVIIGWAFNQLSAYFRRRQGRKQKLNRALFLLLDLRFQISRVDMLEKQLPKYLDDLIPGLGIELTEDITAEKNAIMPILMRMTSNAFFKKEQFEILEKQLDEATHSLSEVQPILAYELSGQYKINDLLNKGESLVNEWNSALGENYPNLSSSVKPVLMNELLEHYDDILRKTAKNISKKCYNETNKKLNEMEKDLESVVSKSISEHIPFIKQQVTDAVKKMTSQDKT